eukprot:CAMPEP_0202461356 /NCGR_PEP_ID=MMETSP1360-20130828/48989_1 /ASSEMBLY_ACC=CAM_ASM_000848 /TAXON_ID=515479 /ORGANISM="Licmophora paradoxa, Strain CCMP2313" /LENGTH=41 /DNA_ID= /DNA_START= /DNA_END= /DNA_ORIENTATION=
MTIIITATINEGGKEFTIECPKTILADRCEGKAGGACTEIA